MKNLATIQRIKKVEKHYNATALDIVQVLGWSVVTHRDQFKEGDLVVYVALDSILPHTNPAFAFLESKNWRVKTQKLRGHVSYGIVFPLNVLNPNLIIKEGMDVTKVMGVEKYEKPVPNCGEAKGVFPISLLKKTDEERLQNVPWVIDELRGKEIYVATKYDGASITHTNMPVEDPEAINALDEKHQGFNVCSRNMLLKRPVGDPDSAFWRETVRNRVEEAIPEGLAMQSELIGEGIQKNSHKLVGNDLRVFNVLDIAQNEPAKLWGLDAMVDFCAMRGWATADIVFRGKFEDLGCETIEDFVKLADKTKYVTPEGKKVQAEGIVVRLVNPEICPKMSKELSFKVISAKYALKHGE